MPAPSSTRLAAMRREPVLPPGFTLTTLREGGDAISHAINHAADLGAASLVWVQRFDLIEFAVVLEPQETLTTARLAHYVAMNALADTLAIHCPPERPIRFGWPDAILFDHGLIGGGQLAWPQDCSDDRVPDWLVFGAMVRTSTLDNGDYDASRIGTSMDEEGFGGIDGVDLIESFARHLMLNVHRWTTEGPKASAKRWLDRLDPVKDVRRGLDLSGDLLSTGPDGEIRRDFLAALAACSWLNPAEGSPKR
jgi:Biotin/lipoate A/B protein ligase family